MQYGITTISGYDAQVYYVDGARSWQPAYRKHGATFWTHAGPLIGHAGTPHAELILEAEAAIVQAIKRGF